MADPKTKTEKDFLDLRVEIGKQVAIWTKEKDADPAVVIAAMLSNVAALAMLRTFGQRGKARDMVQELTDDCFDDAENMMRSVGMTDLLSRADNLINQGRAAEAVKEAKAFKGKVQNDG